MRTRLIAGILGLAALVGAGASVASAKAQSEQSDAPRFEVASVKPSKAGGEREGNIGGGRFTMTHATLRDLVAIAYPREDGHVRGEAQIAAGPSWSNTDHFDVVAYAAGALAGVDASNTAAGASTSAELSSINRVRLMLRSLLAERFKLRAHTEARDLPIYNLVMNRDDRRLGPKLKVVVVDCATKRGSLCGGFAATSRSHYVGHAVTMPTIAALLESPVGRSVFDRTGLGGQFDADLEWAADNQQDVNAPSIFTALEEQLGLRLESTERSVDVLVIDHAEHPTSD